MIKKLTHKITAVISVILILLFVLQLIVLNIINVNNNRRSACMTAGMIANRFDMFNFHKGDDRQSPDFVTPDGYYAVIYDFTGEPVGVFSDGEMSVAEDALKTYLQKVIAQDREEGAVGGLFYSVKRTMTGVVVVLVESSATQTTIRNLAVGSLIVLMIAVLLSVLIARLIAKQIVKPVAETFKKQKQFISDAGHELKTPLTVIGANADMLESEIGENKWLGYIRSETSRMNGLVLNLLTLAKLDNAEETGAVMTEFDMSSAVEGMAMTFESVAFEQGVLIDAHIEDGITLRGNDSEIKQLASILIDNAVKHSVPGGTVTVKLHKGIQKKNIFSVTNQGDPIPPAQREKIFERFYRADEARTGSENRFGLGLAIAKSITEKHKGKISVNCAEGETTFTVVL
ncbi:MAG: HAMP domain-containing histidine kinase [Clostridia bacterium]|nr:HAMP domain-containing histidine kinase [Clostridia bacterium]